MRGRTARAWFEPEDTDGPPDDTPPDGGKGERKPSLRIVK